MLKGLVMAWVFALLSSAYAGADTCVSCHRALDEEELKTPVAGMAVDIHARRGLSCADCHGGDPNSEDMDAAMDAEKGYVGAPAQDEIPGFCGKCHQNPAYIRKFDPGLRVDQVELYWTSVHGQKLREGDEKVATCTDCHGHHGILSVSDPRSQVYPIRIPETCGRCHSDAARMSGYGIPTDQLEKYKRSVHGRLLLELGGRGAPACNDCHGNHGAAPPGVNSVSNVCGQCHPVNAELLAGSPHAKPFEDEGIPACESCHGNHEILHPTDDMLGSGKLSICVSCHEEDSKGYLAAVAMRGAAESLQARHDQADDLLRRAERAGMEVREARFQLNEVENHLTKARASIHAFSLARLEQVVAEGDSLAVACIREGELALEELEFRRKGLGVSLILIVIVGCALYLKIREVDRRRGLP